ncbi:MAG: acetolactate synthase [Rikenellaceae bacterium]
MKRINQLSVFLENKSGRLNEILDIIGQHDIEIIAASVADTSEYGILRMITSNTKKALEVLKQAHVSANISEVIAIRCDNNASAFSNELKKLSNESICIEYMYSFSCGGQSTLILRTNNNALAIETASKYSVNTLTQDQLYQL